jgi:hypothetical protein
MSGASKLDILRMYSLLSHIASINRATVTRPAPSQQMLWDNKKNEGGISRARVNPVSWITTPLATPPSQIAYHILSGDVSLSSLICIIDPQKFTKENFQKR